MKFTGRPKFARFFVGLLLCFSPAFANNHHDHLQDLARPEDFEQVLDAVLNQENILFSTVGDRTQYLKSYLYDTLKIDPSTPGLAAFISNFGPRSTLNDLFKVSGQDPKVIFRRMLSMEGTEYANPAESYQMISGLRKMILNKISPDNFEKIFASFLAQEKRENAGVLDLSLASDFMGQHEKIKRLQALAAQKNIELRFFASIPRKMILNEDNTINRIMAEIREVYASGLIRGIDIPGSLFETSQKAQATLGPQAVADRLARVFDLASELGIPLRLHAFETTSEGVFYDALRILLKKYRRPLALRIGHINALTTDWMELLRQFAETPGHGVTLEANLESNHRLHRTPYEKLVAKMQMARKFGLTLVNGGDGRGIYGVAGTFLAQKARVDAIQAGETPRKRANFATLHSSGSLTCDDRYTQSGGARK